MNPKWNEGFAYNYREVQRKTKQRVFVEKDKKWERRYDWRAGVGSDGGERSFTVKRVTSHDESNFVCLLRRFRRGGKG
jgi:hypothetical protein